MEDNKLNREKSNDWMKSYQEWSPEIIQKLSQFLGLHFPFILEEWLTSMRYNGEQLQPKHPIYHSAKENGYQVLAILYEYLTQPNEYDNLKEQARKIAREIYEYQLQIGDIVYSINLARTITNHYIANSKLQAKEQIDCMLLCNQFINSLTYYTVTEYNDIKDSIIQDKETFIKEMHSDRLTILGQIAASFAHEIRNPLTAIKGFISLIEQDQPKEYRTKNYFKVIKREMDRLQEIVYQFLLLSKKKGFEDLMEVIPVHLTIYEVIEFMQTRFLEENIKVSVHIEGQLTILAVKAQIKQVLLNVVNNAVEELTKCSWDRNIEIKAYHLHHEVIITISNNGYLIPKHLIENIFEPFVTTKELGTGLGLSVCKQIVEKHNGDIQVASSEEKTTFTIRFPWIEAGIIE